MTWRLVWLVTLVWQNVLCSVAGPPARQDASWGSHRNWLAGSHSQVGVAVHGSWVQSGAPSRARLLPPFQPITVQCQEASMVVFVKRDLFGTGKLVRPDDLRLGTAFCRYTSLDADNTVIFQVQLQDCGNTLQATPDFLVYSSILTYLPTPSSTVITRTNQAAVTVECLYPRNGNVSSKAIKPTWIPFSSTVFAEENLGFSLHLMNDDWLSVRSSNIFQLGEVFKMEASVHTGSHLPMRLFVDSCVATLNPNQDSLPQHEIVVSNGCMVDGKLSDGSAFISPRTQPDRLQFTVDAFRFSGDSRSTIFITCRLRAAALAGPLDALNKACSFIPGTGWLPVEGPSHICSCCETLTCSASVSGSRRFQKRGEQLQALAVGPIVVLDEHAVEIRPSFQSSGDIWKSESLEAGAVHGKIWAREKDHNMGTEKLLPLDSLQTEIYMPNKGLIDEDLELYNWPQDGRQLPEDLVTVLQQMEDKNEDREGEVFEMEQQVELNDRAKDAVAVQLQQTKFEQVLKEQEMDLNVKSTVQQLGTAQPVMLQLHRLVGTEIAPQLQTLPENKTLLNGVKTVLLRVLELLGEGFQSSVDATAAQSSSKLGSQMTHVGPEGTQPSMPNGEHHHLEKLRTIGLEGIPLAEQREEFRSIVHSGPVILDDSSSEEPHTGTFDEPEPKVFLGSTAGLVGLSGQMRTDLDAATFELKTLNTSEASGSIELVSAKHYLGLMPQLPVSQIDPVTPFLEHEDDSLPAGEGKVKTDILDAQSIDQHDKLVQLLLLIVAAVVLVCMVVLGGSLVYRRRNNSFV